MIKPNTILALETSTSACSVALKVGEMVDQIYEEGTNLHSIRLLEMVDQLLNKHAIALSDVDLMAVGVGPGAFTGLRIGVGVAQGLAYSHNLPVVGVTSLQALAQSVDIVPDGFVVPGLDARMSEMYWSVFRKDVDGVLAEVLNVHSLSEPANVDLLKTSGSPITFVGNAWSIHSDGFSAEIVGLLAKNQVMDVLPQASHLIDFVILNYQSLEVKQCSQLSPFYVRNDVAKKKKTNPLIL